MRLRLKEDPREWRKFAWALSAALTLAAVLLSVRSGRVTTVSTCLVSLALVNALAGAVWPGVYRPVYRVAMRVSHAMGQVLGRVFLGVLFLVVLTPLALVLRLSGKDLLRLRRREGESEDTLWQPVKSAGPLDRMF